MDEWPMFILVAVLRASKRVNRVGLKHSIAA